MQIKGLGLAGLMAMVTLVGCGSSSGTGATGGVGGSTGKGGAAGSAASGKGGNTGGGGAFTTSVPSGTKLTGLTSAQAAQLCNDVGSYVDNTFIPVLCQASGPANGLDAAYLDLLLNPSASNSELQAACAGAAADAGSCPALAVDGGTQTCNVSSEPSTCQATVGDFTKCLNDSTTADVQYYATLPSCSTLTAAIVTAFFAADGGSSFNPPEPTSCSMFDSTCDVNGDMGISKMRRRVMPNLSR